MDNRTAFLNTIAQALGRPLRFEPQADAAPVNNYANERLTELSPQQRCDAFIQFASEVMLARCELTSEDQAADAALRLCEELGQQPVVLSGDSRLVELGDNVLELARGRPQHPALKSVVPTLASLLAFRKD